METKPIDLSAASRRETSFWSFVAKGDEGSCWEWVGSPSARYPQFFVGGKYIYAHRVDPGDLLVCHVCDNPRCCNPSHLFLGTVKDNNEDKIRKGRHLPGHARARHKTLRPSAKGQEGAIRDRIVKWRNEQRILKYGYTEIAAEFGVSPWLVEDILKNSC